MADPLTVLARAGVQKKRKPKLKPRPLKNESGPINDGMWDRSPISMRGAPGYSAYPTRY